MGSSINPSISLPDFRQAEIFLCGFDLNVGIDRRLKTPAVILAGHNMPRPGRLCYSFDRDKHKLYLGETNRINLKLYAPRSRLQLRLPENYIHLDTMHITCTGKAALSLSGITLNRLTAESWNDPVDLERCAVKEMLNINTTNGAITLRGSAIGGGVLNTIKGNISLDTVTAEVVRAESRDGDISRRSCRIDDWQGYARYGKLFVDGQRVRP